MLDVIQVPLLADNYGYLLHDTESGEVAVIDPSEADPILARLKEKGWTLTAILNTHHHYDHVGGNEKLKAETGARIIASQTDFHHIPDVDRPVREGDQIFIGKTAGYVMETPGHTIGHVAYVFPTEKLVFCGDTLFSLGCGRMFEGTPPQMLASLRRLAALPRDMRLYCGHEYTQANGSFALTIDPNNAALKARCQEVNDLRAAGLPTVPSTVEMELLTNPFIRAPQLLEALNLPSNTPPDKAFAEMRRRKDAF